MKILLVLAINLYLIVDLIRAQTFDIFKSYKDAKMKPAAYSKRRRYRSLRIEEFETI